MPQERTAAEVQLLLQFDTGAAESVRASLTRFKDVYEHLTPFVRKELLLRRAEVSDRQIVLEICPVTAPDMAMPQSRSRSEAPNWLPGQESNLQPSG